MTLPEPASSVLSAVDYAHARIKVLNENLSALEAKAAADVAAIKADAAAAIARVEHLESAVVAHRGIIGAVLVAMSALAFRLFI